MSKRIETIMPDEATQTTPVLTVESNGARSIRQADSVEEIIALRQYTKKNAPAIVGLAELGKNKLTRINGVLPLILDLLVNEALINQGVPKLLKILDNQNTEYANMLAASDSVEEKHKNRWFSNLRNLEMAMVRTIKAIKDMGVDTVQVKNRLNIQLGDNNLNVSQAPDARAALREMFGDIISQVKKVEDLNAGDSKPRDTNGS